MESKKKTSFGQRIATLRKKHKMTLNQLRQMVDISESHISRLESGERQPSREIVERLARAFFPDNRNGPLNELLIAAGFSPLNFESYSEQKDLIAIYEQVLEEDTQDFKTYEALITNLIKVSRYEEAKEKIQQGFLIFDDSVKLQALVSKLELARGNYKEAMMAQQSAIDYYYLKPETEKRTISLAHLLMNLGVIYFMKGDRHLDRKIEAESNSEFENAANERNMAIESLRTGREKFKAALHIVPHDIYILDEYARCNFSLALVDQDNASDCWQKAIEGFKEVLYSDHGHNLGQDKLMEAGIFLAHAYTKCNQFDRAELVIHLIKTYTPNYWLIHYARACFYSLKYEQERQPSLLDLSLQSLKKALQEFDSSNETGKCEALADPDLKAVRELRADAFQQALNG